MSRLVLLTEIPAPYRIPLFNALADRLDLSVLFLRASNPERRYALHADELRFDWEVLPGRDLTVRGHWLVVNRGASRRLRGAEAVILGGWNQPAFWQALVWSRARSVPVILWVESTGRDRRSARLDLVRRAAVSFASAFLVPGSASRDYLVRLGAPAARITVAPNAVDPAIFTLAAPRRSNGPCRLLAVGRLAHDKGLDVLLRAAEGLPVEIVIAGTGPEEPHLRGLAGPNVRFLGQVERDALPALYAETDVLVMPSRSDPWGMVLNEAALAGLPLVSTEAAGAAHELIEHGVNGFRVPADDAAALRDVLRRLCADESFRLAAGARSSEIATRFTPAAWAEAVTGLVTRVVAAARSGAPRSGG